MTDAFILDAVRTPRGRGKAGKGALSNVHPQELLAQTLNQLAARSGVDPREVDDVIAGCVSQVGEQGANIARNAVLAAGWPLEVAGTSVNRFCGSGLQAINFAAMGVMSGMQKLVVAGGVESMSRVGMGADGAGQDGDNLHLRNKVYQVPQGISADLIATVEGISREELDAFALHSQQKAAVAQRECRFGRSLFPVKDPETGAVLLEKDEHLRPDTTQEGLATLGSFLRGDRREIRFHRPPALSRGLRDPPRPHGRQFERHRGRRGGRAPRLAGVRGVPRPEAPGAHPCRGDRRLRAGDHADGSHPGLSEGARPGRHGARGHRPLGDQRGLRGGGSPDDPQPRPSIPSG